MHCMTRMLQNSVCRHKRKWAAVVLNYATSMLHKLERFFGDTELRRLVREPRGQLRAELFKGGRLDSDHPLTGSPHNPHLCSQAQELSQAVEIYSRGSIEGMLCMDTSNVETTFSSPLPNVKRLVGFECAMKSISSLPELG